MKKRISILLAVMMLAGVTGCGGREEAAPPEDTVADESARGGIQSAEDAADDGTEETTDQDADAGTKETADRNADASGSEEQNVGAPETDDAGAGASTRENGGAKADGTAHANVLIAYFSMPEDVDTSGVDAVAGASIVVRENEALGNTQYVAEIVQQTVGGELFRIETVRQYPLDHDPLVDQAAEEQDADVRPELATHIENPEQYDTIVLGFPNWWGDLPQPLYTFLEEYDFSGKTIIPFVTHGGSGFSNTRDTIAGLQPGATVSENTLSLSRNAVLDSEADVVAWAQSLGL